MQTRIIHFHDTGHQAVDANRHADGNNTDHHHLLHERCSLHCTQGDHDDFCRKNKVRAHSTFNLVLLESDQVHIRIRHGLELFLMLPGILFAMEKGMRQFFHPFVTQVGATEHQQRCNQPGQKSADQQRRRHQNKLVAHGAFGYRPDHRQLTFRTNAGGLLRIQRQIIPQYPGGFFCRHLGHYRYIVKHRCDVIEQH